MKDLGSLRADTCTVARKSASSWFFVLAVSDPSRFISACWLKRLLTAELKPLALAMVLDYMDLGFHPVFQFQCFLKKMSSDPETFILSLTTVCNG